MFLLVKVRRAGEAGDWIGSFDFSIIDRVFGSEAGAVAG